MATDKQVLEFLKKRLMMCFLKLKQWAAKQGYEYNGAFGNPDILYQEQKSLVQN